MDVLCSQPPRTKDHFWQCWYHALEALGILPHWNQGSSPCEAPVKCFGLVLLFDNKYFLGDAHPTTNSKIISFLNKMNCLHSSNKRPNHARYRHTTYEASVITNFDGSSPLLIKGLVISEHKYHCMMLAQKCSLNDMVLPDTTRQTNLTTSL